MVFSHVYYFDMYRALQKDDWLLNPFAGASDRGNH